MTAAPDVQEIIERETPAGNFIRFEQRRNTNDGAVAQSLLSDDEYRLRAGYPMTGWAIDIGAHIGSIAIAIAKDNPDLRVVAVEAVPENAEQVRRNIALNDLESQVFVEYRAASDDEKPVEILYNYRQVGVPQRERPVVDPNYVEQCRYIGNIFTHYPGDEIDMDRVSVKGLTLTGILDKYGIDDVTLLKIDCEGCEWQFFRSKSLGRVQRIVGEYHDSGSFAKLARMLSKTHTVDQWTKGPVGLFGADRK